MILSGTEDEALAALRSFLLSCVSAGVEVIVGQQNRVPEPKGAEFVVMTPMFRERLAANTDHYVDSLFTGSIDGSTLTISGVDYGTLFLNNTIFGVGIADGTKITAFGTGSGGVGTYTVAPAQTVTSRKIAGGVLSAAQHVKMTVQLDIHGEFAADNAHIISTLFRDDYAVQLFIDSGYDVAPLYMSEPKQAPYLNGEQQIENRWTTDAVLQVNPIVKAPLQFADQLNVGLFDVDTII